MQKAQLINCCEVFTVGKKKTNFKLPVIFRLIKDNRFHELYELLKNQVDLDERNNEGQTPLIYAGGVGNSRAVKMLLEQEHIDLDARDNFGNNALMVASEKGHIAIVVSVKYFPPSNLFCTIG